MADALKTPPQTHTVTTHGLAIQVGGTVIGAINQWNPGHSRTITELYGFGDGNDGGYGSGAGLPFEKVPGNITGQQISCQRYDLYLAPIETVFGTSRLDELDKQLTAFDITEIFAPFAQASNLGGAARTAQKRERVYRGCWFSERSNSFSSSGDRVVNTSATIQYTRCEIVGNLT